MKFSFKYRIAFIIFILEAIMMGTVLWETLGYSYEASREQLANNERAMLGVVGAVSRSALLTEEYAGLKPYWDEVLQDPHVIRLLLVNENNIVVASTTVDDIGSPLPALEDSADLYWRNYPITNANGRLGELAIEFSSKELAKSTRDARNLGVTIAIIGMLIIAFVGVLVGYLLTRRLDKVTLAATELSTGNMNARTAIKGRDEIGVL
ncbi:MAG: HAMP domain-containing protein, partial [Gammaproteobacteria bacterium]|nr:HAMP domain-containing protein [Gammaproteobacteria bacterium]